MLDADGLVLDQSFDGDSLYQVRAYVAARALQAGSPAHRADDMVMAVHELAANVVRHGPGHGRLRMWTEGPAVICQVRDEGVPGRPGATTQPDNRDDGLPWPSEPGHGLWLVRQVADQAVVRSEADGVTATVSFCTVPAGPTPSFELTQYCQDGCTVLAVTGQFDPHAAGQFTSAVEALVTTNQALRLIVDLSGLTFWDSFALTALLRAQALVNAKPATRMAIAALPAEFTGRLQVSGLTGRLIVADSLDSARTSLASSLSPSRLLKLRSDPVR